MRAILANICGPRFCFVQSKIFCHFYGFQFSNKQLLSGSPVNSSGKCIRQKYRDRQIFTRNFQRCLRPHLRCKRLKKRPKNAPSGALCIILSLKRMAHKAEASHDQNLVEHKVYGSGFLGPRVSAAAAAAHLSLGLKKIVFS